MKFFAFSFLFPCIILFLLSNSVTFSARTDEDFLQCLSHHFSNYTSDEELFYTPNNPLYFTVLNSTIQNPRCASPTTTNPLVIVTPIDFSQVQATVYCSKNHGLQIRTRSGGHDYECLSYVSDVPFVIVDLRNLRSISVNVDEKSAWVQAGATLGEVYYRIAEKSGNLGFPSGGCHTVGVGGHFSGGGYGFSLTRKYGLAADNILDAQIVTAEGRLLDRKSMGEDLFWAIRGGGAASFGVVLSWKIRLSPIPSTVTMFSLGRNYEQDETKKIVNRWQYVADKFPGDLTSFVRFTTVNSTQEANKVTIQATFLAVFLGSADDLLLIVQKSFPELGLTRDDCTETTWIESVLYLAGIPAGQRDRLLNSTPLIRPLPFKVKLDYVKEPIPETVMDKWVERLREEDVGKGLIQLFPYGAEMGNISESEIPFPHRAGNIYQILYYVEWEESNDETSERHMSWIRSAYNYMTPYVSKNPRSAYLNYRDLDLGVNSDKGTTSFAQASVWGNKYFGYKNFKRLVHVKTMVDPTNFFRNEQSIPPLIPAHWKKGGH